MGYLEASRGDSDSKEMLQKQVTFPCSVAHGCRQLPADPTEPSTHSKRTRASPGFQIRTWPDWEQVHALCTRDRGQGGKIPDAPILSPIPTFLAEEWAMGWNLYWNKGRRMLVILIIKNDTNSLVWSACFVPDIILRSLPASLI